MTLHANEIPVDEAVVRALLREQRPEWAELAVAAAGAGTDNRMYRLGTELLVRLPRTAENAEAVRKEQRWLPRLAPHLPCLVPEPLHEGAPGAAFPLAWSVYRWIDGAVVGPDSVTDWATFGAELASTVRQLHEAPLMGAVRGGELGWYRGGAPAAVAEPFAEYFAQARDLPEPVPGLDRLWEIWRRGLELPAPAGRQVWLHGDLKPSNLLAREGRLHAVIDFGGLSVGAPDAEHATVWDLPAEARAAYWAELRLDRATWLRARAWAVGIGIGGVTYYWDRDPAFAAECLARLRSVLDSPEGW
ncbi:Phosphotransferase [Kitasatospora sp. MMS16-BH015]|uniref:aminoglycoside phosphotransferase family protein n=1 Tax=Kitasatospora sp. MMS16-BH015 TaxID=2018025 RepID=UPI000CA3A141|nr:aminoglycoside phosphotransferase family protein [Kitasatospora sp. MMS16-BH015]AUG80712.1 Phosphotransferase [Kitasatospora sp. MMS16-BH015]